jgi:hypothetical protein
MDLLSHLNLERFTHPYFLAACGGLAVFGIIIGFHMRREQRQEALFQEAFYIFEERERNALGLPPPTSPSKFRSQEKSGINYFSPQVLFIGFIFGLVVIGVAIGWALAWPLPDPKIKCDVDGRPIR